MCITLGLAELSSTRLYAGEATRGGRYVHVIAYQNKASSSGPNAMILPIPAAVMPGAENAVDTRGFKHFLDDIHSATQKDRQLGIEIEKESKSPSRAQVFDVGSFTVVLAATLRAIPEALAGVPERKRPAMNAAVLGAFKKLYPGWPLAVCCWDGDIEAEPLLWWYEPRMPEWLFAPALDAHDGRPPRTDAMVEVDHHVAFGSTLHPTGEEVHYQDDVHIPERPAPSWLAPYESDKPPPPRPVASTGLLASRVHGTRVTRSMPNGDFWLSTTALSGPALRRAPDAAEGVPVPLDGWSPWG